MKALKNAGCNYVFHISTFFPDVSYRELNLRRCDRVSKHLVSRVSKVTMMTELSSEERFEFMETVSRTCAHRYNMIHWPTSADPADARFIHLIPAFHSITKLRSHIWMNFALHFSIALRHLTALTDLKMTVHDCLSSSGVQEAFKCLKSLSRLKKLEIRLPLYSAEAHDLAQNFLDGLPEWPSYETLESFNVCEKLLSLQLHDRESLQMLKNRCTNLRQPAAIVPDGCQIHSATSAVLKIDAVDASEAQEVISKLSEALPDLTSLTATSPVGPMDLSAFRYLQNLELTIKDVQDTFDGSFVSEWPSALEDLHIDFSSLPSAKPLGAVIHNILKAPPLKSISFGWHTHPTTDMLTKILMAHSKLKSLSVEGSIASTRPPVSFSHPSLRHLYGDRQSLLPIAAPNLTSLRALLDPQTPSISPLNGCPNVQVMDLQIRIGAGPSENALSATSSLVNLKDLTMRGESHIFDLTLLIRVGYNWRFLQSLTITGFTLHQSSVLVCLQSMFPALSSLHLAAIDEPFETSYFKHVKLKKIFVAFSSQEKAGSEFDGSELPSLETLDIEAKFSEINFGGFEKLKSAKIRVPTAATCEKIRISGCPKLTAVYLVGKFSDVDLEGNALIYRNP
jgi:hypothetical protein